MKIDTAIENVDGRYNVQVASLGFTASEEEKLAELGEPLVQIGGEFSGSILRPGDTENTAVDFTLPTYLRRMRSDFPVKHVFDLADDANADVLAKVWAEAIVSRLTEAKVTLMAETSPFVGETRITV